MEDLDAYLNGPGYDAISRAIAEKEARRAGADAATNASTATAPRAADAPAPGNVPPAAPTNTDTAANTTDEDTDTDYDGQANAGEFDDIDTAAPLNRRQRAFCAHYARYGNGAQAAIFAGYSHHTARFQASRLLTNDNICLHIEALHSARMAARDAAVAHMVRRLRRIEEKAGDADDHHGALRAMTLEARITGLTGAKPLAAPHLAPAWEDAIVDSEIVDEPPAYMQEYRRRSRALQASYAGLDALYYEPPGRDLMREVIDEMNAEVAAEKAAKAAQESAAQERAAQDRTAAERRAAEERERSGATPAAAEPAAEAAPESATESGAESATESGAESPPAPSTETGARGASAPPSPAPTADAPPAPGGRPEPGIRLKAVTRFPAPGARGATAMPDALPDTLPAAAARLDRAGANHRTS
jgi:hypothetical protein